MSHSIVVYALSLDGLNYRYTGATTRGTYYRLLDHRRFAAKGHEAPVYAWMRDVDPENVIATVLEEVDSADDLGDREVAWNARLRAEGHDLLNRVHEARHRPQRNVWQPSPEAIENRRRGQMGVPKPRVSAALKGKPWTDERKGRLKEAMKARGLSETEASSYGQLAAHGRWHVKRGIVKSGCTHCEK